MNIIFSPHIDDAMLSIGGCLINWQKKGISSLVVNIFSKSSFNTLQHDSEINESSLLRKREEQDIARKLDFEVQNLDYPDADMRGYRSLIGPLSYFSRIHRKKDNNLIKEIESRLVDMLKNNVSENIILSPLSPAGHVDHLITREIILGLINKNVTNNIIFYEDLPYCCRYGFPKKVIRKFQLKATLEKIDINQKLMFVQQYKHGVKEKWLREIKKYSYQMGQGVYSERVWTLQNH